MTTQEIWVLYSTFPTQEEALSAAHRLVEKRLVACANVQAQVTSIYRWQGAIAEEQEATMVAKTGKEKLQKAMEIIKKHHSYQMPCIVAYPLGAGSPEFLQWVADETV